MKIPAPSASSPFELGVVMHHIRRQSPREVYIEIGGHLGGSFNAFGLCMSPGAVLISVDQPKQMSRGGERLLDTAKWLTEQGYAATAVLGDSHLPETHARVVAILDGRKADVLFIDGDHSAAGVRADAEDYVPLVRPGGLVVFHDVGPREWIPVDAKPIIDAIYPVWRALDERHRRSLKVQEYCGYGLVWLDGKCDP